jgi:hypothetical protein
LGNLSSHFFGRFHELAGHCRRHVKHAYTLWFQANVFQQFLYPFYSPSGFGITVQVMAIAGQSTGCHHAIDAVFESLQNE